MHKSENPNRSKTDMTTKPSEIINVVLRELAIAKEDFYSKCRKGKIVRARIIAYNLCLEYTRFHTTEILNEMKKNRCLYLHYRDTHIRDLQYSTYKNLYESVKAVFLCSRTESILNKRILLGIEPVYNFPLVY